MVTRGRQATLTAPAQEMDPAAIQKGNIVFLDKEPNTVMAAAPSDLQRCVDLVSEIGRPHHAAAAQIFETHLPADISYAGQEPALSPSEGSHSKMAASASEPRVQARVLGEETA